MVSDIKGGTQTEGVWEQGAEKNALKPDSTGGPYINN
jgi:hypothetical protein